MTFEAHESADGTARTALELLNGNAPLRARRDCSRRGMAGATLRGVIVAAGSRRRRWSTRGASSIDEPTQLD
jgi:hypothetical protein